jgi:beta-N-acetylhexosaminidase
MVGLDVEASRTSLDSVLAQRHLGGVVLLGGWTGGTAGVHSTTRHLADLVSGSSKDGLGLLIAADQEGGNVQQLRGSGFTRIPSALQQGTMTPGGLTAAATVWGKELKQAGVNVNLAPVADTVPASVGTANQPIGRWGREYSHEPGRVATMSVAFLKGMHAAGVATTVKHFPGLGRITGNTDLTVRGITDSVASSADPYLQPFAAGIAAGTDLVMVGSAIYSRLDPGVNAVFSRSIVTGLLRERLGYDGVVITDDVGVAKSVAAVPAGARATRFIAAGGDIVLTASRSTVPVMHDAITAQMKSDRAFAAQVEAAVTRVITLKVERELARCG